MQELDFINKNIERVIMSNSINKTFKKITIRKVILRKEEKYLIEKYTYSGVFHESCDLNIIKKKVIDLFSDFKQIELFTADLKYLVLKSKKNKITVIKKTLKETINFDKNHNKEKKYLLKENHPIYPLIDLGIFNDDFQIIKSSYDKYKQINRFIEFIDEVLQKEEELHIVDFGCGKSYLTFIIYYYLINIKKVKCKITGIDLKEEVVKKCNELKNKYEYEGLEFICMDAKDYTTNQKIDMVISLHACDVATDYCIYHAINWKAKYIFAVPCCQKEINKNIKNKELNIMLQHGLIKERFSSLLTDSIRGEILSCAGYDVNLMEFVDLSHTPKNILIRALFNEKKKKKHLKEIDEILKDFQCEQTLYNLVSKSILFE